MTRFHLKKVSIVLLATLLLIVVLLFILLLSPLPEPPGPASTAPMLLDNVNIVDVETGQIIPNQAVWIDKGVISKIAPSEQRNTDTAKVVETEIMADGRLKVHGAGRYLMPGLADMHTHSMKISPQVHHPLWLASGVTSVRDMSGCMLDDDSLLACTSDRKRWQRQLKNGSRSSPNYWQHASYQVNGGSEAPSDHPDFFQLRSAADATALVLHYKNQGVDLIKVYEELRADQYHWLSIAADSAGMSLAGHQPWLVSFQEMISAKQRSVEHGRLFIFECADAIHTYKQQALQRRFQPEQWRALLQSQNPVLCRQLMEKMAASDTWWSPTLLTLQLGAKAGEATFRKDARLSSVPYLLRMLWQADASAMAKHAHDNKGENVHIELLALAKLQLKQAHSLGVHILAGTDTADSFVFAGSGMHDEMALYQQAGLSSLEVIQTATVNPAIYAGIFAKTGSVNVGKTADLLLLNDNPLKDLATMRQPEAVILAGHWYPKVLLQQLIFFAKNQAQSVKLNLHLLWDMLSSAAFRQQFAD